jgi:hypothetical protein
MIEEINNTKMIDEEKETTKRNAEINAYMNAYVNEEEEKEGEKKQLVSLDYMNKIHKLAPKRIGLVRQVSNNISNQKNEETCFVWAIARLFTKEIRNKEPQFFGHLNEEVTCNEIIQISQMINLSDYLNSNNCNEGNRNYYLVFTYLFTPLKI